MINVPFIKSLPDAPWDEWVKRVILHVPSYYSPNGKPTSGGLQRNVRDIALLIRNNWGKECIIIQKACRPWEEVDKNGIPIIGIKAKLNVLGDPGFGLATTRMVKKEDAIIYMGGEDAWPFFINGAKGFHAGIWWDGPYPYYKKYLTGIRTDALFRACRSVLCVDTNVINWVRTRAYNTWIYANRAVYIPNCVDLEKIPQIRRLAPNKPLRLLYARRFELKRGPELALDACARLVKLGYNIRLLMSTAQGHTGTSQIKKGAKNRGIEDIVETYENDLDSIYPLYIKSDVALIPTLWSEGTSYSCIEAIAAGLPVVTTTVGGLPNLVIPGFNGFVTPPKVEPFSEAIEALLDQSTWGKIHNNCLAMRESFSKHLWDERVLKWIKS